jgi:hypothetical protein
MVIFGGTVEVVGATVVAGTVVGATVVGASEVVVSAESFDPEHAATTSIIAATPMTRLLRSAR